MRPLPRIGPPVEPTAKSLRIGIWALAALIGVWVLSSSPSDILSVIAGVGFYLVLVALAALYQDRFRLESKLPLADPNRVQLIGPLFLIAIALALRAFASYDLVIGSRVVLYSAMSGVCLGLLVWASIRRASLWDSLGIAVILSSSVVVHVNGLALSAPYLLVSGQVVKKYVTSKSRTKMLVIKGERSEAHMRVDETAYDTYALGDGACVFVRSGTLGIEVRSLGPC